MRQGYLDSGCAIEPSWEIPQLFTLLNPERSASQKSTEFRTKIKALSKSLARVDQSGRGHIDHRSATPLLGEAVMPLTRGSG